jgi:hypothetical protein
MLNHFCIEPDDFFVFFHQRVELVGLAGCRELQLVQLLVQISNFEVHQLQNSQYLIRCTVDEKVLVKCFKRLS